MRRATTMHVNVFLPEKYDIRNILLSGTTSDISHKGAGKSKESTTSYVKFSCSSAPTVHRMKPIHARGAPSTIGWEKLEQTP